MFTAQQKSRIKYFLKYPDWQGLSNGIQLGIPAGSQAMFMVEQSFDRLTVAGEQGVLEVLDELEQIECQIKAARKRLKAKKLGEMTLNESEISALKTELEEWRQRLSDTLGAPVNPYTLEHNRGGGINARVVS